MDVLTTALGFALGILVPHLVLAWDESRLSRLERARSWNSASRWSAILAFSFFCIPVHFARTRRSARGVGLGLLLACLGLGFTSLVLEGLMRLRL